MWCRFCCCLKPFEGRCTADGGHEGQSPLNAAGFRPFPCRPNVPNEEPPRKPPRLLPFNETSPKARPNSKPEGPKISMPARGL